MIGIMAAISWEVIMGKQCCSIPNILRLYGLSLSNTKFFSVYKVILSLSSKFLFCKGSFMAALPIIVETIPPQVVNERAAYGPVDLKRFVQSPEGEKLNFSAELRNGGALPRGIICTTDGIITGIPSRDTHGNYEVVLTVENEAGEIQTTFLLNIKPSLATSGEEYTSQLKKQVWDALLSNVPLPELEALRQRAVTPQDIYFLLERWAVLTIWDAFNLSPPGPCVPLDLSDASPHYHVFDRGSCLVATPKDLFSAERTALDALVTAKALAREVYKRDWSIELVGFDKMVRGAWVELQILGDRHGKQLEIVRFDPSIKDLKAYQEETVGAIIRSERSF